MGSLTLIWWSHGRRARHVCHRLRVGAYGYLSAQATQIRRPVSLPFQAHRQRIPGVDRPRRLSTC